MNRYYKKLDLMLPFFTKYKVSKGNMIAWCPFMQLLQDLAAAVAAFFMILGIYLYPDSKICLVM